MIPAQHQTYARVRREDEHVVLEINGEDYWLDYALAQAIGVQLHRVCKAIAEDRSTSARHVLFGSDSEGSE